MNISKRHHYIPEFFIKGFTNEYGKLFYFNKEKNKLETNPRSPSQVLFEWNRNSVEINGNVTDDVEKLFQLAESKFSISYHKIVSGKKITELDLRHLILFILEIHWRVPSQDNNNFIHIQNIDHSKSFFKIRHRKTGKLVPDDVFKEIIQEPIFTKSNTIIRAIEDYLKNEKKVNMENWTMSESSKEGANFNILSDNPVLFRDGIKENILENEMIFPFTKELMVHHTNGKKLTFIPPDKIIGIHVLSFIRAKRFVCSSNLEYLDFIAQMSKLYSDDNKLDILEKSVFSIYE
ncbi:DUF4238 domain-containing protein [Sinomicrobium oceani]|uniref:DUF4238 domain-containing protein n=1 Tax=Sinomicrobium oceani TaxID=1150368 RepID=UPI00227BBC52|nr:DUF4238 domain-containing protein [Sinomicrobium oceani]